MSNKAWKIIKGNQSIKDIPVYGADGVTKLTNLGALTEAKFHVKKTKTTAAIIEKTLGAGIQANTPSSGYVRVTLNAADTALTPAHYYMALQLKWSSAQVYECVLKIDGKETNTLTILQDAVNT